MQSKAERQVIRKLSDLVRRIEVSIPHIDHLEDKTIGKITESKNSDKYIQFSDQNFKAMVRRWIVSAGKRD